MKKSFNRRALALMAMPPLALLCMAQGLHAQELDLTQEEVTIERVAEPDQRPDQREEVKPVSTLEPRPIQPLEVSIEAPEALSVPVEIVEREPVEPVSELEPEGVVLQEVEIEAPVISAEELERAAAQVLEADDEEVIEQEETEDDDVLADLELENQGLETQVCEQRQKISTLEEEIASIQNQATDYMPLLNTMNQLMMMNMNMMMMNQNQLSFQTSPLDMMGSMMSPMMMMQSMSMGMSIASMQNLYHQPTTPMQPQYNYNIGGDFYGRDYSMTQQAQPVQAPYATPFGFDFGGRTPRFSGITPAAPPTGASTQIQNTPPPAPTTQVEEGMVVP